ncbi:MAG: bifunctional riboflavin kinase/FAD synthetase [Halanaerobiales bacterium]|nr:bifunctional riboflavin kinase/FAD synthetase [Halanaerobiales bacterium]
MQLITNQDILNNYGKPMVVALGSFDGVHCGHRVLIKETVRQAEALDFLSGVFTFYPHPLKIIKPERSPGVITTLFQKKKIISELGVDRLIVKDFTKEFASTEFHSFVKNYLVKYLNVKGVIVGEDYRFGRDSMGNVERMKELGQEFGFSVTAFETISINDVEVRSTLIRNLIINGQVEKLPVYLGRPYTLAGKVTHGDGRGRQLGFPTANVTLVDDFVIPKYGVYAVYIEMDGERYPAVANIGFRPTFNKNELSIEIHIMDFSNDLYDKFLEVELILMIRTERLFDSINELVGQIKDDVKKARQILCTNFV